MYISTAFLVPFVVQQCWALPHTQYSRHKYGRRDDPVLNQFRADAVKEAYQHAWDGYYEYAFPHDELHPVSNTSGDSRYVTDANDFLWRSNNTIVMAGEQVLLMLSVQHLSWRIKKSWTSS